MAERVPQPVESRTTLERFEDLARKLIAVPKAEVDALREKNGGRRIRRPTRKR